MKGKTIVILIWVVSLVLVGTAGAVAGSLMDWNFGGFFSKNGEAMLATRPEPDYTLPTVPEITEPMPEAITLKVWTPMEDQLGEGNWLDTMLAQFEAEHPEYDITWKVGAYSMDNVPVDLLSDVETAADVFFFPNELLGSLNNAQVLAKLGGQYLEQVLADNSQTFVDTVTYTDGGVYGFPMEANTWFMYYNKSIFSEEDVKSLDTMLEKGAVAFPMGSWEIWSFYAAGGGTLFGDQGIDASAGIRLGANGAAITKYLVNLANHPNFINDVHYINDDFRTGYAGLIDGSIGAMFSGAWDAAGIREALGDNMGVAPLPTINVDGTEMQLKSFAGCKAIGVNRQSQYMQAALQLAAFLSSPESQLLRYELSAIPPAATELMYQYPVSEDIVVVGQALTMEYTSTVQPCIPEMRNYWSAAGKLGYAICDGKINLENYVEHTDYFEQELNNGGI